MPSQNVFYSLKLFKNFAHPAQHYLFNESSDLFVLSNLSLKMSSIPVVDDDENDLLFLRRAIQRAGLTNPLSFCHDGQEAIDYLAGVPPFDNRIRYPLPGLRLLDLKMPRVNGFDVLSWWSQSPDLKRIRVVVLSSSSHEEDLKKAKDLGAPEFSDQTDRISEFRGADSGSAHRRWLQPSVAAGEDYLSRPQAPRQGWFL